MHPRKWVYGALTTALGTRATPTIQTGPPWTMPDEGELHSRTWMAFAWNASIWTSDLLPVVQENLADVAEAISRFEPVSLLVRSQDMSRAKNLLRGVSNVTLVEAQLDDLWVRDSGPVFVRRDANVSAVNFNFNGWGNKQVHSKDATVAPTIANTSGVPLLHTELVLEGGALEVDGNGTAIMAESCVLNDNRNPGWSKADVEAELMYLLGIEKIIWLLGIRGKDITDGHTDFYARFISPGVVVAAYDPDPESYDHNVTLTHLDILKNATDAKGRTLNVTTLTAPWADKRRREYQDDEDFAAGYINYYLVKGGVIMPQFGDTKADKDARDTLSAMYPDREVVAVNIDGIAAGGGGIHCSTQQEIAYSGPNNATVATTEGGDSTADAATPSASGNSGAGRSRRRGKMGLLASTLLGLAMV